MMGFDYKIYYFCGKCQKTVLHVDASHNKAGGVTCPDCGFRLRTTPVDPNSRKVKVFEYPNLLDGKAK